MKRLTLIIVILLSLVLPASAQDEYTFTYTGAQLQDRLDSEGKKYSVDYTEVDQGVSSGTSYKAVQDAIGATKQATIVLKHWPDVANTTTYAFTTAEVTLSNINIKIERGALISGTLEIASPANIIAADNQQIFAVGASITFTNPGKAYFAWAGEVGAADDTTTCQALLGMLAAGSEVEVIRKHNIIGSDQGTYRHGVSLAGVDNITIRGLNNRTTGFLRNSTDPGFIFRSDPADDTDAVQGVRFTNLYFGDSSTSTSFNDAPIYAYVFHDITIDHCYFENWKAQAVFYGGNGTTTLSTDLNVHDNEAYGGAANVSANGVKSFYAKGIKVNNNIFDKIARCLSVELDTSASYTITDFEFNGNTVRNGAVSTISATNTYLGVQLSGSDGGNVITGGTIANNIFDSNIGQFGLAGQAADIYMLGNSGTETVYGISVTGNIFKNFTDPLGTDVALYIYESHSVTATGNVFQIPNAANTNSMVACRVRESSRCTVNGNTFNGAKWSNGIQENATAELGNHYFGNSSTVAHSFGDASTSKSFVAMRSSSGALNFRSGSSSLALDTALGLRMAADASIIADTVASNLAASGTFAPADGNIFIRNNTNGAAVNLNPSGTFTQGHWIILIESGANDNIVFDSAGLNATVAAGKMGIFTYDDTNNWQGSQVN